MIPSVDTMISYPGQLFIDGAWTSPVGDKVIDVVSPSTEQLFLRVASAQNEDVERAVAAARAAFDHGPWPRMSHAERAGYLREISKQIASRTGDFSDLWTAEVGIVRTISGMVVPAAGHLFDFYASLSDSFAFEERRPAAAGGVGLLVREPVGVVAAIVPWNAPILLMTLKLAAALLAGCTVILKASPEAPGAAYVMAEIMEAIGLPKGVVNVLTADRDVSETLVRHPGVDKVTFTGSSAAGKKIAAICADRVARCTLELGGKSAAVIFDDYDLDKAADTLAGAACLNTGQICASLTRVIVSQDRHDAFVEAMASRFASTQVGDPFDAASQMGPLATAQHRDRVEGYIARGQAEGAMLATGGGRPRHLDRGFYVEPTLFGRVDNNMIIAREEIFGPVVSVIPARDEQEALEIANDSVFGLNASVFTNDNDRAYAAARVLRSGTVGHNSFQSDFTIAFGGFKQSGIGREGGVDGLLPFLETKTVILQGDPAHLPTEGVV